MAQAYNPVTVGQAEEARERIKGVASRTPLMRLYTETQPDIYLKLENLQPIGSFKLRGAANKLLDMKRDELRGGVWTASAGNMALGAAWCARLLGVPFTAVVPETAPQAKLSPIERLEGQIQKVSREEFFEIFSTRRKQGLKGVFVHAFSDPHVMAGNATIALEVLEDLPTVRAIYIPYGGGGLSCGIASVIKQLQDEVTVIACEPATAAPLAASLPVGEMQGADYKPSFVDGSGAPYLYPEMFALARELIDEAVAVLLEDAASAIKLLAERGHVVAEGAGGLPVAAALRHTGEGPVVCVVSGGNINSAWLRAILAGGVPEV